MLAGPQDARSPRELHPVFYGSFDWHSCVHGYWMLARLYRCFPTMPNAAAISDLFDAHLTADLDRGRVPLSGPPLDAWVRAALRLGLVAQAGRRIGIARHAGGPGMVSRPWLRWPDMFAARFAAFLPLATYPVRAGVHSNTAFAVRLALDYPDEALRAC